MVDEAQFARLVAERAAAVPGVVAVGLVGAALAPVTRVELDPDGIAAHGGDVGEAGQRVAAARGGLSIASSVAVNGVSGPLRLVLDGDTGALLGSVARVHEVAEPEALVHVDRVRVVELWFQLDAQASILARARVL
ncbi:MAG TPA: hypothetical protein VGR74_14675, partial [Actinomycetota bacterium]|nr:hypothetical protein [Actinomycetota bacterium]